MFFTPHSRSIPVTWLRSLPKTTSRTQYSRFSIPQCRCTSMAPSTQCAHPKDFRDNVRLQDFRRPARSHYSTAINHMDKVTIICGNVQLVQGGQCGQPQVPTSSIVSS